MRFAILFSLLTIPYASFADTIHVPGDYSTIQGGIDASVNGDTVLVATGTYVENIDFLGKAITVRSSGGSEVTVVNGGQVGSVVTFSNGEDSNSVLEGFQITNGSGTFYAIGPGHWCYCGGGIFCEGSSPLLNNNTIDGNTASRGAGIFCEFNASPTVTNNTITGNTDCGEGGGIYCRDNSSPSIMNNTITGNTTGFGGGIMCRESSPTIMNNKITGNTAEIGGGIICYDHSSPTIVNNTITGHTANMGGGIFCNIESSPTVTNNLISGNKVAGGGGGIYCSDSILSTFTNNTIVGNTAEYGGGIYFIYNPFAKVTNNTISGNTAGYGGGICCFNSSLIITNTILWNNAASSGPEIFIEGNAIHPSSLTISYSDVKSGQSMVYVGSSTSLDWGNGMLDADPLLVDPTCDDYHLTFLSPCKDAGSNSAVAELFDFENDPRIAYGIVDMGADEFHRHLYCTGDAYPNYGIDIKLIGVPMQTADLYIGTGVLASPWHTKYGLWYLIPPISTLNLGMIPWTGVCMIRSRVPPSCPTPLSIPLQGLTRGKLTNLSTIEVRSP